MSAVEETNQKSWCGFGRMGWSVQSVGRDIFELKNELNRLLCLLFFFL